MSRILRRAFASLPPRAGPSRPSAFNPSATLFSPSSASPSASASSVHSTLPQAVRKCRSERPHASPPSPLAAIDTDATAPFSYESEKDFQDLLQMAEFGDVGEPALRELFIQGQNEWRSRVRGYAARGRTGRLAHLLEVMGGTLVASPGVEGASTKAPAQPQIVGQRVYLPNIQIRLMRNHTPSGEAYDPTIATFRIPPSMTKTDLRSYLLAVYNLRVTFIRTDNYLPSVGRSRTGRVIKAGGKGRTYKRAVVGLHEPFHYPDDVEEAYAQGAKNGMGDQLGNARDEWLQEYYNLRQSDEMRKRAMFKYYKGARWRSRTHANLGNTLREIMQRRKDREEKVTEQVKRRYALVSDGRAGEVGGTAEEAQTA